jgi:hypothetical protein
MSNRVSRVLCPGDLVLRYISQCIVQRVVMTKSLLGLLATLRNCFQLPAPSGPALTNPIPNSVSRAREDFIKRLFAVTLSVGIASQIVRIMFDPSHISSQYDWLPLFHQWRTILLLIISLAIVVSSWEGYLGAIERMPLEDALRFWIDIPGIFLSHSDTFKPILWFVVFDSYGDIL